MVVLFVAATLVRSDFLYKFATMKMKTVLFAALALIGVSAGCTAQEAVKTLEPQEFAAAAKADTSGVVLDVRKADEYAEGHLADAANINWLDKEAFAKGECALDRSHTYYIYCRSGRRSLAAAQKMQADGFRVVNMSGGILRWTELGLPLEK